MQVSGRALKMISLPQARSALLLVLALVSGATTRVQCQNQQSFNVLQMPHYEIEGLSSQFSGPADSQQLSLELLSQTPSLQQQQLQAQQTQLELQQQQQQQQQQQHSGTPGHYEFEVAPKMEPPSARRPPFKQTNQLCPGSGESLTEEAEDVFKPQLHETLTSLARSFSTGNPSPDPFGGFSPKHTLCGDLNRGKVPINPLGQFVTEQSYPFELIKNKTLQFLARALPLLKMEYEIIPKVARYLPASQLLNPTSLHSPLGSDHFHQLNRLAGDNVPLQQQQRHGRRKRSLAGAKLGQASMSVDDLPQLVGNSSSLVVSSAHSSAGRIRAGPESGAAVASMITKDGLRPILGASAPLALRSAPLPPQAHKQQQQQAQTSGALQNNGRSQAVQLMGGNKAASGHEQQQLSSGESKLQPTQGAAKSQAKATDDGRRNHATQPQSAPVQPGELAPRHSVNQAEQQPPVAPEGPNAPVASQQRHRTGASPKRLACSEAGGTILSR